MTCNKAIPTLSIILLWYGEGAFDLRPFRSDLRRLNIDFGVVIKRNSLRRLERK